MKTKNPRGAPRKPIGQVKRNLPWRVRGWVIDALKAEGVSGGDIEETLIRVYLLKDPG